jgi:oxygen-dependent protoporphyrinogen oxidase
VGAVAVIGAGITGLTAAYCLKRRGIRVVVYEAGNRIGGVIKSESRDGYLAELGPNSMSRPAPPVLEILTDLGLTPAMVQSSPGARGRHIVKRGKLVRIPTNPAEVLTSRLLSNAAKLAILGEPLVEAMRSAQDESIAAFIRRRFNQEVLDYLVNPYVAGTSAGDPEQLSVRHAMPILHSLERTYGSVMKGLWKTSKAQPDRGAELQPSGGLISFRQGLHQIVDAFKRELQTELRLQSPVTQLRGSPKGWTIGAAFQGAELYDAVIYAAPAHSLAEIDLDFPGGERLATLSSIEHPPVVVVALGFAREQVSHPLGGFGFLTPEVERRRVMGVIFSSSVFPERAPAGHVLLTALAAGTRDPGFAEADNLTIVARVLDELRMLLGVRGEPRFRAIQVWPKAIPQYVLGYGRFKEIADQVEQTNAGLFLAGTYRDGIALADAMASGERSASRVEKLLQAEPVSGGVPAARVQ